MYSDAESLPPEGHHGGHLGGWAPWGTTRGPVCPPCPRFGTVTLRPGLVSHLGAQAWGAVALSDQHLPPQLDLPLGFSAKAGGFICAFCGLALPAPPLGGPWDLWAGLGCSGVSGCVRHYLEGRGEESGQVRRAAGRMESENLVPWIAEPLVGEGRLVGSLTPVLP